MKALTPAQMEAQLAEAAMHFMRRTALQGDEVQTFVAVHNWLQHKIDAGSTAITPPEPLTENENDEE